MDLFKSMLHEGGHLGFWIQTKKHSTFSSLYKEHHSKFSIASKVFLFKDFSNIRFFSCDIAILKKIIIICERSRDQIPSGTLHFSKVKHVLLLHFYNSVTLQC